jgi:Flp pilus assembly pilin Flp
MKKNQNIRSGQTMVEYIIIVCIVAIAALAIFGVFSDRIRGLVSGATVAIGGDQSAADTATSQGSESFVKALQKDGTTSSGN